MVYMEQGITRREKKNGLVAWEENRVASSVTHSEHGKNPHLHKEI